MAFFFSWEKSDDEISQIYRAMREPPKDVNIKDLVGIVIDILVDRIRLSAMENIRDLTENTLSQDMYTDFLGTMRKLMKEKEIEDAKNICMELEKTGKSLKEIRKKQEEIAENLTKKFLTEINKLYNYMILMEVAEGLLYCEKCQRWYPVGNRVKGVPELLPDELRDKDVDLCFLEKWKEKIPKKILIEGKPFSLQ